MADDGKRSEPFQITLPAFGTGPVTGVGLLLILVSLAFKASVLSKAYFVEDDFLFVAEAANNGLTWDYLTRVHKGHLMPGALALVWLLTSIAPYSWALVAFVTIALQAAASIMFLVLLRRLFGDRLWVLAALAVYVFAPLTVPAMSWWSAALNAVPLQLALLAALVAHVRYVRTGQGRWHALGWSAVGMAFSTKGVFIPLVILGVSSAFLAGQGPWARSLLAELRRPVWWAYGLLMAGYALLYWLRRDSAGQDALTGPDSEVVPALVRRLLGETFPTGAVGGPLRWGGVMSTGGLADPATITVIVAWLLIAALVALTCLYRGRAWRAWAILAAYVVAADVVPTVIARATQWDLVGAETRYVADAAVLFALCLALAALPVEGEENVRRRPVPAVLAPAAAAATAAFLVASLISINTFGDSLTGARVRTYLDAARESIAAAAPEVDIYPRPVPPHIVLPWNGSRRLSSHVLAPLAGPEARQRMRNPLPSAKPYVFDDAGKLVPVGQVVPFFEGLKSGKCYPARKLFAVESFGDPSMVVAMAYVSRQPVRVVVELAGDQRAATLPATSVMGSLYYVPHDAPGAGLRISATGEGAQDFCLRAVAFGEPGPVPPRP